MDAPVLECADLTSVVESVLAGAAVPSEPWFDQPQINVTCENATNYC